ncbi:hypothetical protein QJS10_CPB22g01312 [Acorus calamus]|uniref:Uncharacterized protein n=1 Tax=Acorus calamus TaxID=4465 RepID=A0AAV9C2C9_ACOCL|nr:hypothetical protein QJS10_CPB22g01312 [Acorus calamus]
MPVLGGSVARAGSGPVGDYTTVGQGAVGRGRSSATAFWARTSGSSGTFGHPVEDRIDDRPVVSAAESAGGGGFGDGEDAEGVGGGDLDAEAGGRDRSGEGEEEVVVVADDDTYGCIF